MSCPQSQVWVAILTILMPMGNNSRVLQVHLLNHLMNLRLVFFMFAFSVFGIDSLTHGYSLFYFFLKKSQVVETNVAEHVAYDEQQKAFKELDSASNTNSHIGIVEHQEQKSESKVATALYFL